MLFGIFHDIHLHFKVLKSMQHLYNNFLQEHSTTPKIDLLCLYTLKCKLSLQTNELVSLITKYSLKASSVSKLLNSQEARGYKCLHYSLGEAVTWALRELNQVDIVTNTRVTSFMQEILFGKQSLRIRPKKGVKLYFNFPEKKIDHQTGDLLKTMQNRVYRTIEIFSK